MIMPIGNQNLTDSKTSLNQAITAPGMAHFAGSGPAGKFCGDCAFRGYHRIRQEQKYNPKTDQWVDSAYRYGGCAKFKQLTGRNGPEIDNRLHACKYFEQKRP